MFDGFLESGIRDRSQVLSGESVVAAAKQFRRVNCSEGARNCFGVINGRWSGLEFRRCYPIIASPRIRAWEAVEAVDGRDLGSEYSELAKFPKFPPLLCVGNFGKIGVRCSVLPKAFGPEKCQPELEGTN